jgi:hypothetical protein
LPELASVYGYRVYFIFLFRLLILFAKKLKCTPDIRVLLEKRVSGKWDTVFTVDLTH